MLETIQKRFSHIVPISHILPLQTDRFRFAAVDENAFNCAAIIKFPSDFPATPDKGLALQREFAALSSCSHDGLVRALRLIDDETSGARGLVTSAPSGIPVGDIKWDQRNRQMHAVKMGAKVARVLDHLHRERHLMHLDVCANTVFYNVESGEVTLTDLSNCTSFSQVPSKYIAPSPEFVSPEMSGRLSNSCPDYRADLYSLGALMFRIAFGRPHVNARTPEEFILAAVGQPSLSPLTVCRDAHPVLSEIILELLSKHPDTRYNSAWGLAHDLELVLHALEAGDTRKFPIRQQDHPFVVVPRPRLFGREVELLEMKFAEDRFREKKQPTSIFIEGAAGVGKSAIVRHFTQGLKDYNIFTAKVDQFSDRRPLSAFHELLSSVLTAFISLPEGISMLAAIPHAQTLSAILPQLAKVLPPVSKVDLADEPEVSLMAIKNRMQAACTEFIRVFALCSGAPMLLWIDDAQWLPAGSLEMIFHLLSVTSQDQLSKQAPILVIISYRPDELTESSPLLKGKQALMEPGNAFTMPSYLVVGPLSATYIRALLADVFHIPSSDPIIVETSELLLRKTGGVPLFINKFLEAAFSRQFINYDPAANKWTIDIYAMHEITDSPNVVEFIVSVMNHLSHELKQLIGVASLLGKQFSLKDLEETMLEAMKYDFKAKAEFLRTSYPVSQLVRDVFSRALADSIFEINEYGTLFFTHDKIQQAALGLLDPDLAVICDVSDLMKELPTLDIEHGDTRSLAFMLMLRLHRLGHQNIRIHLLPQVHNIAKLVTMCTRASLESGSYEIAASYSALGWSLYDLITEHAALVPLVLVHMEAMYLTERFAEAQQAYDTGINLAARLEERVPFYRLRMSMYGQTGNYLEASAIGITCLQDLGVDVPTGEPPMDLVDRLFDEMMIQVDPENNDPIAFADKLVEPDPKSSYYFIHSSILAVIQELFPNLYLGGRFPTYNYVAVLGFQQTFKYGKVAASCCVGATVGFIVGNYRGNHILGNWCLRMATRLMSQYNGPQYSQVRGQFGIFSASGSPFYQTNSDMLAMGRVAFENSIEAADPYYTSIAAYMYLEFAFLCGMSIQDFFEQYPPFLDFLLKSKIPDNYMIPYGILNMYYTLAGDVSQSPLFMYRDSLEYSIQNLNAGIRCMHNVCGMVLASIEIANPASALLLVRDFEKSNFVSYRGAVPWIDYFWCSGLVIGLCFLASLENAESGKTNAGISSPMGQLHYLLPGTIESPQQNAISVSKAGVPVPVVSPAAPAAATTGAASEAATPTPSMVSSTSSLSLSSSTPSAHASKNAADGVGAHPPAAHVSSTPAATAERARSGSGAGIGLDSSNSANSTGTGTGSSKGHSNTFSSGSGSGDSPTNVLMYHDMLPEEYRVRMLAELVRREDQLRKFHTHSVNKANFFSKYHLIHGFAELVRGNISNAVQLIDAAARYEEAGIFMLHVRAIAAETLCRLIILYPSLTSHYDINVSARFCASLYQLWGAKVKAHDINDRFSTDTGSEIDRESKGSSGNDSFTMIKSRPIGNYSNRAMHSRMTTIPGSLERQAAVDVMTVLHNTTVIALESNATVLKEKLATSIMQYTGATKLCLFLDNGTGNLILEAMASHEGPENLVSVKTTSIPFEDFDECPRTLVEASFRLACISLSQSFDLAVDPYIKQRFYSDESSVVKPYSICTIPMVHQGATIGVIFLENDTTTSVFRAHMLGTLELLITNMSASLTNLRLQEEKRAYIEELEMINSKLKDSLRLKDVILSTTSHELRTPLIGIIGFSEQMLQTYGEVDSVVKIPADAVSAFKIILSCGWQLNTLVTDILEVAKREKAVISVGPVVIRKELEDTHNLFQSMRSEVMKAKVRFEITVDPEVPDTINIDRVRMLQVVRNLIDNALKFTDNGAVTVHVRMSSDPFAPPDKPSGRSFIEFKIGDSGIGIPPEDHERIFEAFTQVESYETRHSEGLGLGLHIVQQICQLHGAKLTLASKLGEGSTFTVQFPTDLPVNSAILQREFAGNTRKNAGDDESDSASSTSSRSRRMLEMRTSAYQSSMGRKNQLGAGSSNGSEKSLGCPREGSMRSSLSLEALIAPSSSSTTTAAVRASTTVADGPDSAAASSAIGDIPPSTASTTSERPGSSTKSSSDRQMSPQQGTLSTVAVAAIGSSDLGPSSGHAADSLSINSGPAPTRGLGSRAHSIVSSDSTVTSTPKPQLASSVASAGHPGSASESASAGTAGGTGSGAAGTGPGSMQHSSSRAASVRSTSPSLSPAILKASTGPHGGGGGGSSASAHSNYASYSPLLPHAAANAASGDDHHELRASSRGSDRPLSAPIAAGDGEPAAGGAPAVLSKVDAQSTSTPFLSAIPHPVEPKVVSAQTSSGGGMTVNAPTQASGARLKVLAVDDNYLNSKILDNFLRGAGYDVVLASDGLQALRVLRSGGRHDFVCVLMDWMMPEMDGVTACAEIRQSWSMIELPVIFITAKSDSVDAKVAFSSGGNDFLSKPMSRDLLLSRVGVWCSTTISYRSVVQTLPQEKQIREHQQQLADCSAPAAAAAAEHHQQVQPGAKPPQPAQQPQ